jgi:hypothetical protein
VAITTASPEIYSDRKVIVYTWGSKEKISWNALTIPSIIEAVNYDSLNLIMEQSQDLRNLGFQHCNACLSDTLFRR